MGTAPISARNQGCTNFLAAAQKRARFWRGRLRAPARELLAGSACVLSAASVWEVAIKHHIGKLSIGPALFRDRMLAAGAELLAVSDAHAIETAALPRHHDDPFDRMLIAQARVEKLRAVSADRARLGYELDLATA